MTDPIIQAAAEAACRDHLAPERIADHPDPRMAVGACCECQRRAEAVVAAVTPLIRAQALRDHAASLRAEYPQHGSLSAPNITAVIVTAAASAADYRAVLEEQ